MTNTEIKEVIKILKKEGCNSKKQAIEYLEGKLKIFKTGQYQKALEEIVKSSCPVAMKSKKYCDECIIHKSCNCIAKDYIDTLQKLINEQKKELGWIE